MKGHNYFSRKHNHEEWLEWNPSKSEEESTTHGRKARAGILNCSLDNKVPDMLVLQKYFKWKQLQV